MLIDIDKIIVGDRIRKDFGDLEELAEDIKENTLLNALVVTPSGNGDGTYLLIAGERRLRACKLLGYTAVPVNTVGVDDAEQALMMEISENECRKEFTKTERLEYARRLARIESAKARERQTSGVKNPEGGRAREKVAQALGVSDKTIRQDQFIADNADLLTPADFADWDEGRLSTNKAYLRVKAARDQAERERKMAEMERDRAKSDLAEAYRTGELLESQIASLKQQVAAKPKPEVVEREVKPADYDETKRKVASLEHTNEVYHKDYQRLRKKLEETRKELEQANELLGEKERDGDATRDIEQLTIATNHYLRQYGGKAWAFDQIGRVDETTRREFEKAITSMAAFSQNLAQMIRDNKE